MEKEISAIYVRVSTKHQAEEGYSIAAQLEKLNYFCKSKGWENVKEYVDGGFSGSKLDRPAIQELIKDANDKKIKRVIVFKLDRLSRSQKDTLFLIEDVFINNDVEFISLNESLDTSTPFGKAMIGILSVFAQLERENIYLRTRIGLKERIKQGYWRGGGTIPYGYKYDKEQGILVPNEFAENVPKIYKLYLEGYGEQRIANTFGIKYDRLVHGILQHNVYLGLVQYKGEIFKGLHQPLVSEEMFNLVQKRMRERSTGKRANPTCNHLLSGLIYCGECGSRMRYIKWNKDGQYKMSCYSRFKDKPYMHKTEHCDMENVWAEQIEQLVLDDLFNISVNMEQGSEAFKDKTVSDPLKELEKMISHKKNQISKMMKLYASGFADFAEEELKETIQGFKFELNDLYDQYEFEKETQISCKTISYIIDKVVNIRDTWDTLNKMEKQALIRECVEKVTISSDEVEIRYTFLEANAESDSATNVA